MYFMNFFINIIPAFCVLVWNNVSSEYSFIGCFGIIEDHSNGSKTIAPKENYLLDDCPQGILPPG